MSGWLMGSLATCRRRCLRFFIMHCPVCGQMSACTPHHLPPPALISYTSRAQARVGRRGTHNAALPFLSIPLPSHWPPYVVLRGTALPSCTSSVAQATPPAPPSECAHTERALCFIRGHGWWRRREALRMADSLPLPLLPLARSLYPSHASLTYSIAFSFSQPLRLNIE